MGKAQDELNRAELRRIMGMYDLTPAEVAVIIGKSPATVGQYRSISGASISEDDLSLLRRACAGDK